MIQSNLFRSLVLLLCGVGALAHVVSPSCGRAQDQAALPTRGAVDTGDSEFVTLPQQISPQPTSPAASGAEVLFGIEGLFRVGCWTGVRVEGDSQPPPRVVTEDGDGVSVAYVQANGPANGPTNERPHGSAWTYVIPGSEAAPLVIQRAVSQPEDATTNPQAAEPQAAERQATERQAAGNDDATIVTRFPPIGSPTRESSQVPLGMPWVVCFGDPLGVEQIGANALLKRDATVAVSRPSAPEHLPDSVIGYDGVDLIMVEASGIELLSALNPAQQEAITQWVHSGGRLLLMLGKSLPQWKSAAPWLLDFLPASPDSDWMRVELEPAAIEAFTSTQTPLTPFMGIKLPRGVGEVIITGRTTRRVSTPIAAEYVAGLGKVTVITADLNEAPFVDWPQRLDLVTSLTGSLLQSDNTPFTKTNRATAYDDLAGQMRSALDQFQSQSRLGFSLVSLILIGLIALIGPLDYLLVNRVLGKPILGWFTFPLMAIAISVLLVLQARPVAVADSEDASGSSANSAAPAPADPQANSGLHSNRVEIVDLDVESRLGTVFTWNTLYTHEACQLDLSVTPSAAFAGFSKRIDSNLTFPFGFPGRSFGAIQVTGESARLPGYEVLLDTTSSAWTSKLSDLPLAPRSSKSFASQLRFVVNIADDLSMQSRSGTELLEGSLSNPLPVDVLNGMLIYRNWIYFLPTRFPAGARIASVDSLRQKNFRWQLSRQKALESATETESWDPAATASLERIAEIMMFHDAVGAARYTGLKNEVLSGLDFSDVLTSERCILIGKLAKPVTQFRGENGFDDTIEVDKSLSMMRLVIPVTSKQR